MYYVEILENLTSTPLEAEIGPRSQRQNSIRDSHVITEHAFMFLRFTSQSHTSHWRIVSYSSVLRVFYIQFSMYCISQSLTRTIVTCHIFTIMFNRAQVPRSESNRLGPRRLTAD